MSWTGAAQSLHRHVLLIRDHSLFIVENFNTVKTEFHCIYLKFIKFWL